jgi:hypothetical protein
MTSLSREQVERLAQWDSGTYSCDCPDVCPTLPCQNDGDVDVVAAVAARLAEARAEVVRDVEARLTEVIQERDLYASGRSEEIAAGIAPTVAAMLAEARADVVRDVAAIPAPGPFDYLADWAQYRSLVLQALDRHMPSRKGIR